MLIEVLIVMEKLRLKYKFLTLIISLNKKKFLYNDSNEIVASYFSNSLLTVIGSGTFNLKQVNRNIFIRQNELI